MFCYLLKTLNRLLDVTECVYLLLRRNFSDAREFYVLILKLLQPHKNKDFMSLELIELWSR